MQRVELVRETAGKTERAVGVLADLQGPKIRIGKFEDGKVALQPGDRFMLDADCELGDQEQSASTTRNCRTTCKAGDTLLLDDGRIDADVSSVSRRRASSPWSLVGRRAVQQQGHQPPGRRPTAPALTAKDIEDIRTAASSRPISSAVSFPRRAPTCTWRASCCAPPAARPMLIAKIERAEAIPALEEILQGLRRHHGRARRPRGRGGRRGRAGAAEAHDPAWRAS